MPLADYKVNLQDDLAECEANYWRLLKLLPRQRDKMAYDVALPDGSTVRLTLAVEQQCPYTSIIRIEQSRSEMLGFGQKLEVRAYHDAMLAEVTATQHERRIRPRYPYPNQKMFQQDEKRQQNRFLTELLSHCLKQGLAVNVGEVCES